MERSPSRNARTRLNFFFFGINGAPWILQSRPPLSPHPFLFSVQCLTHMCFLISLSLQQSTLHSYKGSAQIPDVDLELNYPLSTPMIKVQNKTLSGSSQNLPYLQNSHCLVSIHKDFECQHDINDMTLCLMTSGSMRHQSLICGHRQVAFPQVVTCHLAFTLNRSFEHLSHSENHGALLHPYFWVVLSWHTRSRITAPNRFDDTTH